MIRQPETDADFAACAAIKNAVEPDEPVTVEELRAARGGTLYLHDGGGYVYVAPSSVTGGAYTMVRVTPEARGRGIGSALLDVARDHARGLNKTAMWGRVAIGDDASLAFVARRGFDEVDREVELVRELGADEGDAPEGIVELGERHRAGAYAVAVECTPDMPSAGPAEAPPYRELVTYTSELNAPMRALNVKVGYEERPVAVVVSGAVG